jgi:hypothetical protein
MQRVEASRELVHREWLHQVIIRSGSEPFDAALHRIERGEHQDRRLVPSIAQRTAQPRTVGLWKHPVEDDGIECVRERERASLPAGACEIDAVAPKLQKVPEVRRQIWIVLHDEDSHFPPAF